MWGGAKISNCKIGKFCSIAGLSQIGFGKHPTDMVSTHPAFYSNNKPFSTFADKNYVEEYGTIEIGNDVWIGARALVMPNVSIGDGAIIAAGSVVTKDIAPYSIVGGVPAKLIRYRFNQDIIDKLIKNQWWNKDEKYFTEHFRNFHDVNTFLTNDYH